MNILSGTLVWLTVAGLTTQLDWERPGAANAVCLLILAVSATVSSVIWLDLD